MIPSDVASRLQIAADVAARPVATTQEVSDKLSGLAAGQRIIAEIVAHLPNGAYRALINQRNITLALPFAAKSGDVLELLVTESDGKLSLAVLSKANGEGASSAGTGTATTLSRAGQLIGSLLTQAKGSPEEQKAVPLNGNRPLAGAPPQAAQDILPALKQAIAQSGMFYEAHQAEWVGGRYPTAALLEEPQGRLSMPQSAPAEPPATTNAPPSAVPTTAPERQALEARLPPPAPIAQEAAPASLPDKAAGQAPTTQQAAQVVHPTLQPLVQQQLEALASQTFAWQGQIWPGQQMHWEIDADQSGNTASEDEAMPTWATRLRLSLPHLGDIEARLRLQGDQVSLTLSASDTDTRERLRAAGGALRHQFDDAGLSLATLGVAAPAESQAHGE